MNRISYADIPKGMFESLMNVENFINESSIEFGLLELIRLRVSQKNGCAYCVDMHHKECVHAGVSEAKLVSIVVWEEANCFSDKERAVLRFADNLTKLDRAGLSDEVYKPLSDYFSKEEICYLTLCISQINTWTRLMKTFRFESGHYKVST
jgi:AhpD family alkylhydroperoxidase